MDHATTLWTGGLRDVVPLRALVTMAKLELHKFDLLYSALTPKDAG